MIKLKEMKEKFIKKSYLMTATTLSVASLMPSAFALPDLQYETIDGVEDIMTTIGGYILTLFRYVGVFLLIWAAAQLFLAFKNEDADSKSKAMMMLIVAVLMIMIKSIVNGVLGKVGA